MNLSLVIETAVASLMGGGVGWVTNAVAIDMLFKKYGRWGGVIVEHYKDFIENMSQLVETDLLNSRTLKQELSSEGFKDVLCVLIEDILKKELPESSGSLRFADIPGIETSVDGIIVLVEKVQPALFQKLYTVIAREKIGALVSEEQYRHLVTANVPAVFSDKDHYTYKIQGILADFLKNKSIRALISDKVVRQIVENIKTVVQKVDLSAYNGHIDTAYEDILAAMEIDRIIKDLQDTLSRMRFSDFVNNTEKLSRELVKKALDFARSPEGQAMMTQIITDFLQDARRINLKLDDIVSLSVKTGIVRFCRTKTPKIMDRIAALVLDSRSEIETIINDTVNEQLDRTPGGKIGNALRRVFAEDRRGAFDFNAVDTIIKALGQYGDTAGTEISGRIAGLIENSTVGDAVSYALDTGYITVPSVAELINRNLRDSENSDINFIATFLDGEIGGTFGDVDLSGIRTTLLPRVFDHIKREYLYTDRFKLYINTNITDQAMKIVDKTVTDFFDVHAVTIPLNVEKITNSLLELWEGVSEIAICAVFGENLEIPPLKRQLFQNFWDTHKNRDLNLLYKTVQNDQIYVKITEWIVGILDQNMDTLLTGRVSELVNKELNKLEPKEINTMVQDFMGKEMNSINILGAVLGFVIGGLSAVGASLIGVPSAFLWWMLAVYGGIFATVGIGTNYLAIKMLFRPYKALFPFSWANMPPFIGVAPARKPEFARTVGAFVKTGLLRDTALADFFVSNRDAMKIVCFKRVSAGNYAVIDDFLRDPVRIDRLRAMLCEALRPHITVRREKIARAATQVFARWVAGEGTDGFIPLLRDGIMKKLTESGSVRAATHIEKGIREGAYKKAIEGFMDRNLKGIFEHIARVLTQDLTFDNVKERFAAYEEWFVLYAANHSITDTAGNKAVEAFIGKTTGRIGPLLRSFAVLLVRMLETAVKEECGPEKRLDSVFNGVLPRVLKKNSGFIIDMAVSEAGARRGTLIDGIKARMPFYALPWKGHVEPIVNALLDRELPAFLRRKQKQIEAVIIETLRENRLSDLGFDHKSLDIATIERTVAAILDSPRVQQGVSRFAGIIIKQLAGLPIRTLLDFINIRSIKDLMRVVEPLLSTTVDTVRNNLTKDEAIDVIVRAVKHIILSVLDTVTVTELVKNIDLNKEMQVLFTKLMTDDAVVQSVSDMVEEMLRSIERNLSFYNDAVLQQDIGRFIGLLGGEQEWERLRAAAAPEIKELLSQLNAALSVETKNAVCNDYLLTAILNAAETHFPLLIRSVDVQAVVEREINVMPPAGIEKMFYKFAGSYFGKITFYGWIGIFGGFLSYAAGCALAIILR
jgi:uncharacterized membrane protein YheB (UPF0754 family)